jgi:hypothetical protein
LARFAASFAGSNSIRTAHDCIYNLGAMADKPNRPWPSIRGQLDQIDQQLARKPPPGAVDEGARSVDRISG